MFGRKKKNKCPLLYEKHLRSNPVSSALHGRYRQEIVGVDHIGPITTVIEYDMLDDPDANGTYTYGYYMCANCGERTGRFAGGMGEN